MNARACCISLLSLATGMVMVREVLLYCLRPGGVPKAVVNPAPRETPGSLVVRRGQYVSGFADADAEELDWMGRFDIVHGGGVVDPLPPEAIAQLRGAGVKTLLAYEWMPASYHYVDNSGDDPLMQWAYSHRYTATLNPEGPFPHCTAEGYDWCEDYYYDLACTAVLSRRVEYLAEMVESLGYDGLFFDWGSGRFLAAPEYETISTTYHLRHPDLPYPQAVADFYTALREKRPDLSIETNQGFHWAGYHLPIVDRDMTESYVTGWDFYSRTLYVEGQGLITVPQTIYYPVSVDELHGTLSDTIGYLDYLADLREEYAGPRFQATVYMNYAAPEYVPTGQIIDGHTVYTTAVPRNAIYFGYAVPKLLDQMAYTEVTWDKRLERDEIYFYDLGEPLGTGYERIAEGYARYYTGGIVLVGEVETTTEVLLHSPYIPAGVTIYDPFEGVWRVSSDGSLTVTVRPRLDSLTGGMAPFGRLYLYAVTGLEIDADSPTILGKATTLTATVTGGSNTSFVWSLGDGAAGNGAIVTHTYPAVGLYTAVVTITNTFGPITAAITVPVISSTPFCLYLPVVMHNVP